MVVSPVAIGLLVSAKDSEEDGDEDEEQAAGQGQADDHFFKTERRKKRKAVRTHQKMIVSVDGSGERESHVCLSPLTAPDTPYPCRLR